jgi:glycosyltransferase involved in cell wall biosynthesis
MIHPTKGCAETLTRPTVAVIGNASTNTSSGKFLGKFIQMIGPSCRMVYVVNDGYLPREIECVESVRATACIQQIKGRPSAAQFFWRQSLVQLLYAFSLIKIRRSQIVIFFPITAPLPVILARLMRKRTLLYEAQDVLADRPMTGLPAKTKFLIGSLVPRKLTLEFVDGIIVEGKHVALQNGLQSYSSKLTTCPQYIDSNRYRITVPYGDREHLIAFVAALVKRKGAMEFASAVNIVAETNPEYRFIIVGSGPLKTEIAALLSKHISEGTVKMMDSLGEDEFVPFLNRLGLLVLPSTHEGLPNIVLEAMSCGTPVLATKVGAIPDVIDDGQNGFLVDTNSPNDLAKGIVRAMQESDIEGISENARRLMVEEYSLEASVARYRAIFADAMSAKPGRDRDSGKVSQ